MAIAAFVLFAASTVQAAEVPLADFARGPQYRSVKISPDGDYLAANAVVEDKAALSLIRLKDLTGYSVPNDDDTEVFDFFWANPHKVVYGVAQRNAFLEKPQPTGDLYIADVVEASNKVLYRADLGQDFAPASLLSALPDDPQHVLVQTDVYATRPWDGAIAQAFRVDLGTLRKQKVATAPERGMDFIADAHGSVRIATGRAEDNRYKVYYRDDDAAQWKLVFDRSEEQGPVYPLRFDRTGQQVYVDCAGEHDVGGLCRWDVVSQKRETLWSGAESGPMALLSTTDDRDIFAVASMPDRPRINLLDRQAPEGVLLAELHRRFTGERVTLENASSDGSKRIVLVDSDINPGQFYLYDTKLKSLTPILSNMPWIKPQTMAQMEPVKLSSRDGLPLHGYLTKPLGKEDAAGLPLVVMVHGGPFGVRDEWGFDPEVQMLASRGYAVLQVNFRGSGGYGYDFLHAGYREWGGKMQDDVTDATRWAIDKGIADPGRICIFGGSYGGYAALEGAVKEPDLYRCAIGYVGIYDLRLMHTRGNLRHSKNGRNYLKEAVGDDPAMLKDRSPIEHLNRLKASVLLAVGGADRRVPAEQGKKLHDALDDRHIAHEWIYHETEGHGFFNEQNRLDLYQRIIAFLDRNIGTQHRGESGGEPR